MHQESWKAVWVQQLGSVNKHSTFCQIHIGGEDISFGRIRILYLAFKVRGQWPFLWANVLQSFPSVGRERSRKHTAVGERISHLDLSDCS
jgi:hypothetical protein